MIRSLGKMVVSIITSAAIAVALVPVAPMATRSVDEAQAAPAKTVTVTRAASSKLTMKKGSSYKLAAKASSGKLKYKSSKPKIVSVSNKGKLKAKKNGKAVVTVKIAGTRISKKIKVTVVAKKKFKKVKSIRLKISNDKLTVGGNTSARITFSPKKPSNKNVIYKSSAPSVAAVDAYGTVVAKSAGVAKITATSCDKKSAKSSINVRVVARNNTSGNQNAKNPSKPSSPGSGAEDDEYGYSDPDQRAPHDTSLDKYPALEEEVDPEVMAPMELDPDYANVHEYREDVRAFKGVKWSIKTKGHNGEDDVYSIDPDTLSEEVAESGNADSSAGENTGLKEGDRVVFEPTDDNPQGAWFLVKQISDDGKTVTAGDPTDRENVSPGEGAELGDSNYDDDDDYYYDDDDYYYDDDGGQFDKIAKSLPYKELDVETVGGALAEGGFKPAEGVTYTTEEVGSGDQIDLSGDDDNDVVEVGTNTNSGKAAIKRSSKSSRPRKIGGEAKIPLTKFKIKVKNISFSVQPTAEVKVDLDWFSVNELYAAITMNEELSGKVELKAAGEAIKLGDFYFATNVPGLYLELATYLNINASGEIKVTFGASQTLGYSYRGGQSKLVKECVTNTVKMDAKGEMSVGLDETLSVNALAKPIADISLGGDIGVAWEGFKTRTTGSVCSDLNVKFSCGIEIGKHDSLLSKFGVSFARGLFEIPIKSWHIENNKFVSRCNFDKGTVEGYAKDARTGSGIKATVKVYTDKNCTKECTSSNGLKMLQATDGWYKFEAFAGTYYVKVTHPSYSSDVKKVKVKKERNIHAGTSVLVRQSAAPGSSGSGSGAINANTYNVILTWGKDPEDLDSHYNSGNTHVYFEKMNDGDASLDVDDTTSYGPETITVSKLGSGFTYSVHDYTNARDTGASTALSYSGANVKVYKGATLIEEFNVPRRKAGTLWTVFSIDANGKIKPINKMSYQSDQELVGA